MVDDEKVSDTVWTTKSGRRKGVRDDEKVYDTVLANPSIRVFKVDLALAWRIVAARDGFDEPLAFNTHRPAAFITCSPERDIMMMRAPVRHRAAGSDGGLTKKIAA